MSKKKDTIMDQWLEWLDDANRRFYNRDVMSLAAKRMELDQREAKISNREQLLELRKKKLDRRESDLDDRVARTIEFEHKVQDREDDIQSRRFEPDRYLWTIEYIHRNGGMSPTEVKVGESFDYTVVSEILGEVSRAKAITLKRVR